MAKIVLRDGTDGARRKFVQTFKQEFTHAFMHVSTSSPTLGATLTPTQVGDVSSDTVSRVRELNFSSSATIFQTQNDLQQLDDNKITAFFILASRPVDKVVYVKPSSSNWIVNGYATVTTVNPMQNTVNFVSELKIEFLDQV